MGDDRLPDSPRIAGIMTMGELSRAGVAADQVRVLVRRGVLTRVDHGVYARAALASGIDIRTLRVAAALAVAGPGTAASHYDAALLHGISLLDRPPDTVALTRSLAAPGGRSRRPALRIHRAALPFDQVVRRQGLTATSAARTVIDLARMTPFRSGVVTADCALRLGKTTRAELGRVLATCARWPGVERARRVVAFSDGRSESAFESIARVAFRDGGLPPPDLQVWVGGDSGPVGRADFLWRAHATIAEADGALKYADPDRARQQLRRDADLRAAGFEVVHIGWAG
jgi:putative AbiEi antitoxin of type IV toxin-antitoxin system